MSCYMYDHQLCYQLRHAFEGNLGQWEAHAIIYFYVNIDVIIVSFA